ncbi:serine hydrolase [Chitinophaga sp. XS-30]|uniref:serine hydrolase domain-containing protein n=1 Tax=Chitinophaga sp. XS-30 TaxID=2604421 RepID=UPI0011DC9A8E|nr:serine hydrolase domain-containing protein [Chitinophaga sp. XS-30]QEH43569.1 beta-lactamase family protein [Chitinophaga sp. XS-30]
MAHLVKKAFGNMLIICLGLQLTFNTCIAQSKLDTLTAELNSAFIRDSLYGLSVALVNANGIVYQKNFGFADIKNGIPYNANTIQNIGSVSKSLIGIAIMKAIELEYFTLETNINDILPFKVINPNHPDDIITIRELTNHTSGIIDNDSIYPNSYKFYPALRSYDKELMGWIGTKGYQEKIKDANMKDFFYNYLCKEGKYYSRKNFSPDKAGKTYAYSNLGSALAAHLIEIKSGTSYDKFTTQYILEPLKMNNSGWFIDAAQLKSHARLYYNRDKDFPLYSLLTYPDGGLRTSCNDLSKYLMAVIKGYNGDVSLLSNASFKQMFSPMFTEADAPEGLNFKNRNKGVFWNLYSNGTIGLDGDDPGVSAYLFFNPATGLGGLFLSNKFMDDKKDIVELLVRATFDL